MGATAPKTPVEMLVLHFWPVDMRNGILAGTAKLETTPIGIDCVDNNELYRKLYYFYQI